MATVAAATDTALAAGTQVVGHTAAVHVDMPAERVVMPAAVLAADTRAVPAVDIAAAALAVDSAAVVMPAVAAAMAVAVIGKAEVLRS